MALVLFLESRRLPHPVSEIFVHAQKGDNSVSVIRAAAEIVDVRELHDRLIAGTARALRLPLLSNDPEIQHSSYVETLW
ncbi:MAG: hypothetical protein D6790_14975 [Caldilineae bacterium]|nr:MAG: hypothetical protein D6790_14975 [Caldilineae bacterium]